MTTIQHYSRILGLLAKQYSEYKSINIEDLNNPIFLLNYFEKNLGLWELQRITRPRKNALGMFLDPYLENPLSDVPQAYSINRKHVVWCRHTGVVLLAYDVIIKYNEFKHNKKEGLLGKPMVLQVQSAPQVIHDALNSDSEDQWLLGAQLFLNHYWNSMTGRQPQFV